jgi:hypothetical protein
MRAIYMQNIFIRIFVFDIFAPIYAHLAERICRGTCSHLSASIAAASQSLHHKERCGSRSVSINPLMGCPLGRNLRYAKNSEEGRFLVGRKVCICGPRLPLDCGGARIEWRILPLPTGRVKLSIMERAGTTAPGATSPFVNVKRSRISQLQTRGNHPRPRPSRRPLRGLLRMRKPSPDRSASPSPA